MVLLLDKASSPWSMTGGGGHRIGSHLGGGPFHRSSVSQMSDDLPTTTNPSLQEYSTPDMNDRVPFVSLYRPLAMLAGEPHSRYLHFGGKSLKKPELRHVLVEGPLMRLPALHRYSITDPISTDLARMVEFAGLSGFPHVRGRC